VYKRAEASRKIWIWPAPYLLVSSNPGQLSVPHEGKPEGSTLGSTLVLGLKYCTRIHTAIFAGYQLKSSVWIGRRG
jgi:hypothetical protein